MLMQSRPESVRLTDEQMRQFITQGYLAMRVELPRELNEAICRKIDTEVAGGGNNLLPRIPEMRQVFNHPRVTGALASVLGESYQMHQHRYGHANAPQNPAGPWHKDSYWGYTQRVRNHRPWWAMIMYYPQDTWQENGPTGVIPGSQYLMTRQHDDEKDATSVIGEAGTFFIIQYDLWHRSSPNVSNRKRYMLKFEFMRLDLPQAPAWDCRDRAWHESEAKPPLQSPAIWSHAWNWLANNRVTPNGDVPIKPLIEQLRHGSEHKSLNAAYALATAGEPAAASMADVLENSGELVQLAAAYGLGAMGTPATDVLLSKIKSTSSAVRSLAAYALGEVAGRDDEVTRSLVEASRDGDAVVRLRVVEALGMRTVASDAAVQALIDRLTDAEVEVGFFACLALARLGPAAAEATQALTRCLQHENRYIRGHAVEALHRIGTPEALTTMIDYLKASRWCESTTAKQPFFP